MFALVINGGVSATADTTRTVTGGEWLPMTEDPATYDPGQPQQPAGFTVDEAQVIRHWRATPRTATIEDLAPAIERAQRIETELRARALTDAGRQPGQPWVPPAGYFDAYPAGWEATHSGKTWIATQDGAAGEPGVDDGWREKQEPGQIIEWVQPHAGEEHPPGSLVTHIGHLWRNDLGAPNGFAPGVSHSGWTDLGEYPA